MSSARINLYDNNGEIQSSGLVRVDNGRVSLDSWVYGGSHVTRMPVGLIRRIALDWVADGADRAYQGHDERADAGFRIEPEKEA